ncbi:MAG: N-acetylglucosamine-6-phosphate deacetylase [Zymomonas mobilis]|uniref:N-acetylglucosamine-6-phosphate deacetylase n=1 Tax=Zymomonas mobilis TaxID=542 RepID=UPI0001B704B9|nr:N-acetylglucosamine-6-phosphate deacetylase [Zymomonas mobilis]ACV74891.1 N-acetylglucosamine-6-phosphate deacetylase [Zymomonas mobilis subsp. mobilis NCIMB 11163]
MQLAFTHGQIVTPDTILTDHSLLIENGVIKAITDQPLPCNIPTIDLHHQILLAGFIDIQVNGGGGCLFNDHPDVNSISKIAAAHRAFGTTSLLPTLVSEETTVIKKAVHAIEDAIQAGIKGIVGLHIEGPFIAMTRRGIHAASKIRPISKEDINFLCDSARKNKDNFRILLTLAPETMDASIITKLTEAGVIVSIGHSDSDYETAMKAVKAGASGFTHLFNAMSQNTSRAPAVVGAALDSDNSYAGIIADGEHVHPSNIRLAYKAKGADHLMLITDAMPLTGWEEDHFLLQGQMIYRRDGRITDDKNVLAGSLLDTATAFANMVKMTDISLVEASRMASLTPARFLGLQDRGSIEIGKRADLVVMDEALKLQSVWISGEKY